MVAVPSNGVPYIAVVEDSLGDATLVRRAFSRFEPAIQVRIYFEPDELISYVEAGKGAPSPSIVMLDLSFSDIREGEVDVLQRLKSHVRLQHVPIIVYSGTDDPEVINACYRAGTSAYLVKPTNYDESIEQLRSMYDFWFKRVRLVQQTKDRSSVA